MAKQGELESRIEELTIENARLRAKLSSLERSRDMTVGTLHIYPDLMYRQTPGGALVEVWRNSTTSESDPPGLISV